MTARLRTECDLCGGGLRLVLSLGSSPPTCAMTSVDAPVATEAHHPLDLMFCDRCQLGQLSVAVEQWVSFPTGYPYQSGNSRALHADFEDLAREADDWVGGLSPDDLVVDIGANDGTLLSKFPDCRKIGVEPTRQALRIQGTAYREFFTEELADRIVAEHGHAAVVTACNVLAHVNDVHYVMRGIKRLLGPDGLLIAENHDLASVAAGQWDTVYHEHLRFYSPHAFRELLAMHGLGLRAWTEIPTHGGSFRAFAEPGPDGCKVPARGDYDFYGLAQSATAARRAIRNTVKGLAWGVGATARATTLINYCGLDVEDMPCVVEVAGSDKIGHYVPGTRIPVLDESLLFEMQPPAVLLLSWHLADVIVPRLRERGYLGDVIVPLPQLRVHSVPRAVAA